MSQRSSASASRRVRDSVNSDPYLTARSGVSIPLSSMNNEAIPRRQERSLPTPQAPTPQQHRFANHQLHEQEESYSPHSSSPNPPISTGHDSNTGMPYRRSPPNHVDDRITSQTADYVYNTRDPEVAPSPEKGSSRSNSKLVENAPYQRDRERTQISRKDLGIWNVASLIINKQIGTGIFTTPGLVLGLTGSKTIALVLWIVGGAWAALRCVNSHAAIMGPV